MRKQSPASTNMAAFTWIHCETKHGEPVIGEKTNVRNSTGDSGEQLLTFALPFLGPAVTVQVLVNIPLVGTWFAPNVTPKRISQNLCHFGNH